MSTPGLGSPLPEGSSGQETTTLAGGPALLTVSIGTFVVAALSTAVRFAVRVRLTRKPKTILGWDDYSIVVAIIIGLIATIFAGIEGVSMDDETKALQFNYLAQPWVMFATTMAKISVCFFFIKTIGKSRPWRQILAALIVILAVVNMVYAIFSNLQCRPLEKLWSPQVAGECVDRNVQLNIGFFQGGFAVFTFFFLAMFPVMMLKDIPLIRAFRLPFYILSGAMIVAGVLSIVRTHQTSVNGAQPVYTNSTLVATILELIIQNLGITAANILPLAPLFSKRARAIDFSRALNGANDDNELIIQSKPSGSRRLNEAVAAAVVSKRDTTLIIQGPRHGDAEDTSSSTTLHDSDDEEMAKHGRREEDSDEEGKDKRVISMEFSAADAEQFQKIDAEALSKGILRTICVEIIEEDRDSNDSDDERLGDNAWVGVLKGTTHR